VYLAVALAAVAAAGATVGATLLTREHDLGSAAASPAQPGAPPLVLDLGLRDDPEARELRRAGRLYDRGQRSEAERVFAGHGSLEGRVGALLAAWPQGTVDGLARLAATHPRSALVRVNLGLALYWIGRRAEAEGAWQDAGRLQPDTPYALRAEDLLHPRFPPGRPPFLPSFAAPAVIAELPPQAQLNALRRAAAAGGARARLLYGGALQRLGRPLSARRQFAAAAAAAPRNAEAQIAAAVGLFEKARPSLAFARLGPLARRFPREPSVRFHLGLLLLWLGDVAEARRQLTLARDLGPSSSLGRQAEAFLRRLPKKLPEDGTR
jgi:tetratricopeptide (TPR) repeat protein